MLWRSIQRAQISWQDWVLAESSLTDYLMLIPSLLCGGLALWQLDRRQSKV